MIHINKAEILDILPYTFKSDEFTALSKAIAAMTARLYEMGAAALFWADIDHASPIVLDAIAAELDAPFYTSDMEDERKRAILKAAYRYNSTIGTVSSMAELLAAAFGGGSVEEWESYGGEPYHFRLAVRSEPERHITASGYELLRTKIADVKPMCAKMDELRISRAAQLGIYVGVAYVKTYKRFVVPAAQMPDEERGYN